MSRRRPGSAPGVSLRLRVVLITASTVAVMTALVGLATILTVREGSFRAADWLATERAEEVAELASADNLPDILTTELGDETAVQVLRDRRVISATANVADSPMLTDGLVPPTDHDIRRVDTLPGLGPGPYSVAVVVLPTPGGAATVVAAVSSEDAQEVAAAALRIGAVGLCLLVLPLSTVLWVAVGRTLAPVEAIRERAEAITGSRLSERVPEPDRLDEIGRLARTINAMLARLDSSAEGQRRFLADAAHELRSPVASLRAQLESLPPTTPDVGERPIDDLLTDTLRMQALVDQLVTLARSDAGMVQITRVPVDLDEIVATVLSSPGRGSRTDRPTVSAAGVRPAQTVGDETLLEQVVRNLVDNAVRHARHRVEVSLEQVDDRAVLTVDDDGTGVPAAQRERIFHRFTRLDAARDRDQGGVGLGLAIVAEIVAQHGGRIAVLDAPLGGARFQVSLPLLG